MGKNKMTLQVKGFEEYMERLDKLGGGDAMKRGVESALKASKQHVNAKLTAAMAPSNLPAGGKYSTGETMDSINREMIVKWEGMMASINVGFDFKKSGLTSIMLMYGTSGTPRMAPVPGLYDAIYGTKTKTELKKIQEEALNKVIKRIMEG